MKQKQCKVCGIIFPELFFHSNGPQKKIATCKGCTNTANDEKKKQNRPRTKAQRAYKNHAVKFKKEGLIAHHKELHDIYGWDIERMSIDIVEASHKDCPYCETRFADLVHGLSDIQCDIIDPNRQPFYRVNVAWVCSTCNRTKQQMTPEEWAIHLQCYKKWNQHQERAKDDPYGGLPLLQGLSVDSAQMALYIGGK